ncbi:MAG: alpha-L-fucosidase, partial [Bacteroidales bacterium]|nr:alpha-L-fucosidase [Bacteroidales bacterium]
VWKGKKMEEMRRPYVAEWVQYGAEIPREEYAALADDFNPTDFDADAVAKLAKDAGMKYLVITTKHHDGFAMYDSDYSDFDIMDATPYKQDVVKALYDACQKYEIDFGIYYSHNIDWADGHDCQYSVIKSNNDALGKKTEIFGPNLWDPSSNTFDEYLEQKAYPQVKELLTKFPNMKQLWYDMSRYMTADQSYDFYKVAYDIQPQMIINERVGNGFGDFDIPGDNKIPSDMSEITKPWQTVGTLNNSWGYKSYDHDWKSVKELLFWLVEIVSKGGNYMLNIGPTASGEVPQESITNLQQVGEWLKINGEAIYGTSAWKVNHEGPTKIKMGGTHERQQHGFSMNFTTEDFWYTKRENTVYAISLENSSQALLKSLPNNQYDINKVTLLGSDKELNWNQTEKGLKVELPTELPSATGYVLAVSCKAK